MCGGLEWDIGCDPLFFVGSGTPEPVSSRQTIATMRQGPAFRIQEKHANTILEHLLEQGEFVRDKTYAKFSVASILRFSRAAENAWRQGVRRELARGVYRLALRPESENG